MGRVLLVLLLSAVAAVPVVNDRHQHTSASRAHVVLRAMHSRVETRRGHKDFTVQAQSSHLLRNSTGPSLCDVQLENSVQAFASNPDCDLLISGLAEANPEFMDLCGNSCFNTVVNQTTALAKMGCPVGVDLTDFAVVCDMMTSCSTATAKRCVSNWVEQDCSSSVFIADPCKKYSHCTVDKGSECLTQSQADTSSKLTLIISLPLDMVAELFKLLHGEAYCRAVTLSAQLPESRCEITDVKKGSVVLTSVLTVTAEESVEDVASALDSSIKSKTFVDTLNSELDGLVFVPEVTLITMVTSAPTAPIPASTTTDDDEPATPDAPATPDTSEASVEDGGVVEGETEGDGESGAMDDSASEEVVVEANVTSVGVHGRGVRCLNNCSRHGRCVLNPDTAMPECQCQQGYGRSSLDAEQDCSEYTLDMCAESCHGRGRCTPRGNNTMACECHDGFYTDLCNLWNRCDGLNYCSGHGNCTRSAQDEACVCEPGFTGADCSQRVFGCVNQCSGHGVCGVAEDASRVCECDEGFGTSDCSRVGEPFCEAHCNGMGRCEGGACQCRLGASGDDCSVITDACGGCGHGYCREGVCECVDGFTGDHCSVYDAAADTQCSALHFCNGRGVCHRPNGTLTNATCMCFEGFTGPRCASVDVNYEDECPDYCSGHGTCVSIPAPHCSCDAGWGGSSCAESKCSLHDGKVCGGHGVCEEEGEGGEFACVCDEGFQLGGAKACEVSLCANGCSGHGSCSSEGVCTCAAGFSGDDCSVATTARHVLVGASAKVEGVEEGAEEDREDEEAGLVLDPSSCEHSCSKHGECVMGVCQCKSGYTGSDCGEELPSLYEEGSEELDDIDLLEVDEALELHDAPSMARLWD